MADLTFRIFGKDMGASRALRGVADQAGKTGAALGGTKASTIATGTALGSLAAGGIAAAGLGLKSIIDTQGEFESTMNVFQQMTGETSGKMEQLSGFAMKMGADTVFSATEAAAAMLELGRAGISTADIQGGALASALSIAATEGMDLAQAAEVAAKSMNAFGLQGKDAGMIADALAGASNASAASVQTLSDGLKYVGSTAHSFKLSINDTTAALAALNTAGLDGTTAGTSLNRMIMGLVPSTKKAGEAFDRLKLDDNSFFKANGQMKDMTAITAELVKTFGGLDDATRAAEMKKVFGIEGMRAAQILYATGTKKVNEYVEATKKQGSAQALADARMKGTKGAMETMRGSIETLALKIGQQLAPVVVTLADALAGAANWVGENIDVIGPLVGILGAWLVVTKAAAIAEAVFTAIKVAGTVATEGAAASQWSLNAALTANPVGLVVAAIAALVAIVVLAYKKNETFRNIVNAAWAGIKVAVGAVVAWFQQYVWPALKVVLGAIGAYFKFLWTTYSTVIGWIIDKGKTLVEWFRSLPDRVSSAVSGLWDGFKNGFRAVLNWIIDKWNDFGLELKIPDDVPLIGGRGISFNTPNIPHLAAGGIVTGPTMAIIGEAGTETVLPYDARKMGHGGTVVELHLNGPVYGGSRSSVGRELLALINEAIDSNAATAGRLATR